MTAFSVVVPIRDDDKTYAHLTKFLPASCRLCPHEIIFGVDEPLSDTLACHIKDIMEDQSREHFRYHFQEVRRDPTWKMHVAHVVDECIRNAHTDTVLLCNADQIPRDTLSHGSSLCSKSTPCVTYTGRFLDHTIRGYLLWYYGRIRACRSIPPPSGTFWIDVPSYRECVSQEAFQTIHNAFDTFIIESLRSYRQVIQKRTIGMDCLEPTNSVLPWRQYANGIWMYSHGYSRHRIRIRSMVAQLPYLYRGYVWASSHRDHKVVTAASDMTFIDWSYLGGSIVRNLADWESKGVGF